MFFVQDKIERTIWYLKFEYAQKQRKCTACNGSGYYDHNDSPDCGCCGGTGKESYQTEESKNMIKRVDELFNQIKSSCNDDLLLTAKTFMKMTKGKLQFHFYKKEYSDYALIQYSKACAFNLALKEKDYIKSCISASFL